MGVRSWALGLAVLLIGCNGPTYHQANQDQVDGWVASMAAVATLDNTEQDETPEPQPGDECPTCNGTGRTGDGRSSVTCLDCGGDGVYGQASEDEGPRWLEDLREARALSRETGKPVLVYFGTEWCSYCPAVWEELNNEDNQELLGRFVWLKVDGDEQPGLVRDFRVSAYPSVLIGNVGLTHYYTHSGARGVTQAIERRVTWAETN